MWPNIQTFPTPAQWIDSRRAWNDAREAGQSASFLGLESVDYFAAVTYGQAQSEAGQSASFLGLESVDYFAAVTYGQAQAEAGQSASFLGLESVDYAPVTPVDFGTPANEPQSVAAFLGLDYFNYV